MSGRVVKKRERPTAQQFTPRASTPPRLNSELTRRYFHSVEYQEEVHGGTMDWKRLLAHITGSVDRELLLRDEYRLPRTAFSEIKSQGYSS